MKKICIYMLLLVSTSLLGQVNLVPNPSFEDTVSCPNTLFQINRAVGWESVRPSPDYFNACAPFGNYVSVPSNIIGTQDPASGSAYAGIYAKMEANNYREYIGSQMLLPMQVGTKYYLEMKVNLAATKYIGPEYCGVNKMGVLFSTTPYSVAVPAPICNCSQIFTDSIITDTLNWVTIKGSFIADSNYSYINVGNFFTDSLTDSIQLAGTMSFAYYYIDDICVSTDSAYCSNFVYTGISENASVKTILFYPNPVIDFLTFEGRGIYIGEIVLFDSYGRLLKKTKYSNSMKSSWDLTDLAIGVYNINVYSENKLILKKIIVKL